MKRLCQVLKKSEKINIIDEDNLKDALRIAYTKNIYKFYLNSELIDVNDRFRIFNFKGKNYISKKTTYKDGSEEISLAKRAENKLDNIMIGQYTIKIIKPIMLNVDDINYIITEYQGTSLQEIAYCSNIQNNLPIGVIFETLDKLISLGILYRGFLPRNIVLREHTIYLLDWEDAIFYDVSENIGINMLWKTNFLLNWSYIYDIEELETYIRKYNHLNEPNLLKYELNFGKWIMADKNEENLRNLIFNTVMVAEKKLDIKTDDFYIMPNDLAHLIADLFNSDIDVLFDITCYVLRKKSINIYYKFIIFLSNLIVELYYKNYQIQPYVILIILMMFETTAKYNYTIEKTIEKYTSIGRFMSDLKSVKSNLIDSFVNFSHKKLEKRLTKTINSIVDQYNGEKKELKLQNNIVDYLWSIKIQGEVYND